MAEQDTLARSKDVQRDRILKAPFPWFGGKSLVASIVWERFGNVPNYVEPFFGSGAVLLRRPHDDFGDETVNDKDGYVCNAWRAIRYAPESVAEWADWPPTENDLHARHAWLVNHKDELPRRLEGNPEYYDAKVAGWWLWGMACWIGSEFCSGKGPWQVVDGQLLHVGNSGQGVHRQRLHLGGSGQGVHRKRLHLGNSGQGVHRQLLHLGNSGRGVHRQRLRPSDGIYEWMQNLSDRMRRVPVCCGDWSRICGPTPTYKKGLTGVFLDPPYGGDTGRDNAIYTEEDLTVAAEVCQWAIANGDNPLLRIAVCGYAGEHAFPDSWPMHAWKASNGYQSSNGHREVIWFSPHCLNPDRRQMHMFEGTMGYG